MTRRLEVHDIFKDALQYGLAVIDGLDDDTLEGLEQEATDD